MEASVGILRGSRTHLVAETLRRWSLATSPGTFLGSEAELILRLKVDRSTFRQAAKLVELDHLISISNGVHGGYYSALPSASSVLRATTSYLADRKITVTDILQITIPLTIALCREASLCRSQTLRNQAERYVARESLTSHENKTSIEVMNTELEAFNIIIEMASNPSLEIIIIVFQQIYLKSIGSDIFKYSAIIIDQFRKYRLSLMNAILENDPDVAEIIARKISALMQTAIENNILHSQIDLSVPNYTIDA